MTDTILLGVAEVDITPVRPIHLAGFSFRTEPFESISTPLSLKCFLFGESLQGQEKRRTAVFSADLLWWGRDTVATVRRVLLAEVPQAQDWNLVFLATHTHCGPQVSCYFASGLGQPDGEYVSFLTDAVVRVAREADARHTRVRAVRYEGTSDISINRRKVIDGAMTMAPNPDGPRSPRILLTEFMGDDGNCVAVMACSTCHPTTSGDNRVDKEFLAQGLDLYLQKHAPQAVGMFVQGCCGDVRPALVKAGKFYRGSLDNETRQLAVQFAQELESARKGQGLPVSFFDSPRLETSVVDLPLATGFDHEDRASLVFATDEKAEWARHFADTPVPQSIPLELAYLSLADVLSFFFYSGEVVGEYGRYVEKLSGGNVWAGGYYNGMTTYIPTDSQVPEKGYEAYDALFYFLAPAPFSVGVEDVLKKATQDLLRM